MNTWINAALFLLLASLAFYADQLLNREEIIYEQLSNYLNPEMASDIAEKSQTTGRIMVKYITQMLIYSFKAILLTTLFYGAFFIFNIPLNWKQTLTAVLLTYPLLFLDEFTRLFYFQFFEPDYSYAQLRSFHPFSFGWLLKQAGLSLEGKSYAFFNTFTLTGIAFCLAAASVLNRHTVKSSTAVTLLTYLISLAAWKLMILLIFAPRTGFITAISLLPQHLP